MWIDEADGFAEIFKGYLPYYLLVALPILIIMSPVNPVAASHEFSVYRMQQYDLHTVPHGSRSSSFNLEGRSLTSWSTSRHCVVARLKDITIEQFLEIRNKAGALLLVMPRNNTALTDEEREHIQLLEMAMVQKEVSAPVYFAHWTPEFEDILQDLQHGFVSDRSGTALEAMLNTVSSNGYQFVVSAPAPARLDARPVTLHARLPGRAGAARTIVVAATYDAAGAAPDLSVGADSNASGAVGVLELARIFSRLHARAPARGGAALLFVLGGAGRALNYFSTKRWLEEQLDAPDATLLQDVSFVMCLDAISSSRSLTMHVSKPPAPGGAAHSLQERLGAPVAHKKINLADELLAWHHERFSIRRLSAFTLSARQSHRDPARSSVLDGPSEAHVQHLVANIARTARALASHLYNLTAEGSADDAALYDDALSVDEAAVRLWYAYLSAQARAPQALGAAGPGSGLTAALERALSRYGEVTLSTHALDKREPEYALYGPTRATLFVYSVKPAVFDLALSAAVAAYLCGVWLALRALPRGYHCYAAALARSHKAQ